MRAAAETEHYPFGRQFVCYVPGSGKGACQTVKFGHHEGVTGAAGCHSFAESGTNFIRSRQSLVHIDLFLIDTMARRAFRWAVRSWPVVETRT